MGEDVYVGIDVSKTELVVAARPSGESLMDLPRFRRRCWAAVTSRR